MEEARKSSMSGVEIVYRNLSFLCFLAVLGVVYIGNKHYAEKKIRLMESYKSEIEVMTWEYTDIKQEIQNQSRLSVLRRDLEKDGLKESRSLPKKIKAKI